MAATLLWQTRLHWPRKLLKLLWVLFLRIHLYSCYLGLLCLESQDSSFSTMTDSQLFCANCLPLLFSSFTPGIPVRCSVDLLIPFPSLSLSPSYLSSPLSSWAEFWVNSRETTWHSGWVHRLEIAWRRSHHLSVPVSLLVPWGQTILSTCLCLVWRLVEASQALPGPHGTLYKIPYSTPVY